jgi:hypothetical protein
MNSFLISPNRAARTAAAVITAAALALPITACGATSLHTGSRRASAASATPDSQLLAFSHCVRRHGVPNFPDPQPGASNSKFPTARRLGISSTRLSTAENACEHLLPAGTDDQFPATEVQVLLTGMLRFSQCMRHHGVLNWPDPSTDSEGRPLFLLSAHGFTRQQARSPRIMHMEQQCQHLLPGALGGVPVG